jgi:hypothetical protein
MIKNTTAQVSMAVPPLSTSPHSITPVRRGSPSGSLPLAYRVDGSKGWRGGQAKTMRPTSLNSSNPRKDRDVSCPVDQHPARPVPPENLSQLKFLTFAPSHDHPCAVPFPVSVHRAR